MDLTIQRLIEDFVCNGSKDKIQLNKGNNKRDEYNIFVTYIIRHTLSGKIYPNNGMIPVRTYRHINDLKDNKHSVKELQEAYNKDNHLEWLSLL